MAKQQNLTPRQFLTYMRDTCLTDIRYICGKWIVNGVEYQLDGNNGLYNIVGSRDRMYNYFDKKSNRKEFISFMQDVAHDQFGEWPEPIILREARDLSMLKPLAYPLTEKELKIIHYLLEGNPQDTYAVFFYGAGGTGKSSVCNIIKQIFGAHDVSLCRFADMSNRFNAESLSGVRLWYDDDINTNWSSDTAKVSALKKIVTHSQDQFEKKGQDTYISQYRCKPLFCCNRIPNFDVTDTGLLRRLLVYVKDSPSIRLESNEDFSTKIWDHEELVNFVAHALQTDINNFYKDFEKETKISIMSRNTVYKYGMNKHYDLYKEECISKGDFPYKEDKFNELKSLFAQWEEDLDDRDNEIQERYSF